MNTSILAKVNLQTLTDNVNKHFDNKTNDF